MMSSLVTPNCSRSVCMYIAFGLSALIKKLAMQSNTLKLSQDVASVLLYQTAVQYVPPVPHRIILFLPDASLVH
jgi:hypothetical protein